jgi:protein SCO1/2
MAGSGTRHRLVTPCVAIASLLFALACGGETTPELDTLFRVADFELTDQDGEAFQVSSLDDQVWVASFLFTSCEATCPTLAGHLSNLQSRLSGYRGRVHIVSITVDPEHDDPAALRAYGERFNRDPAMWTFLTGDPRPVREVLQRAFLQPDPERREIEAAPGYDVFHGTSVLLIDRTRTCRGIFPLGGEGMDTLVRAIEHLL